MDQHRFDHLTKSLAGGASRRSALKALAGVAAGGLAALVGGGVEAAPKSGGKPPCCPTGYNALCPSAAGPTCTDTKTDENNCGACGVVCPSGATCVNGVCEAADPTCTDGIKNGDETDIDCGGNSGICPRCADDQTCLIDTDCQNGFCCGGVCARLGVSCNTGMPGICEAGTTQCVDGAVVCVQTQQPQPETCNGLDDDCDGFADEDFDLQTDENNCGSCGTVCGSGETCEAGVCTSEASVCGNGTCDAGETCETCPIDCPECSACVPGTTQRCYSGPEGTAGVGVCAAGTQTCQGTGLWGPCEGEVLPSTETCNGLDDDCDGMADEDFDLSSDPLNCGGCGTVCQAPDNGIATCESGMYAYQCDAGYVECTEGCCTATTVTAAFSPSVGVVRIEGSGFAVATAAGIIVLEGADQGFPASTFVSHTDSVIDVSVASGTLVAGVSVTTPTGVVSFDGPDFTVS